KMPTATRVANFDLQHSSFLMLLRTPRDGGNALKLWPAAASADPLRRHAGLAWAVATCGKPQTASRHNSCTDPPDHKRNSNLGLPPTPLRRRYRRLRVP